MPKKKIKFMIIDGNAIVHRAWHALPPMTTKDGRVVNAVYGFLTTFFKALKEYKPEYVAVTFDRKEKTFRHKEYKEYKATRKKQPNELYAQIPIIKEVLEAFKIKIYEKVGYEADDLIGTLCEKRQVDRDDVLSIIVTGDMDALQLVDDNTEVYTLRRGMSDTVIYNEKAVREKYDGLGPEQLVDYRGLRGDPSDNIPGVPGVGEKTAIGLIKEYESIEKLYKKVQIGQHKNVKITERLYNLLQENEKQALMSKKLSRIVRDVKMDFKLQDAKLPEYNKQEVIGVLSDLEFKSLLNRLPENYDPASEITVASTRGKHDYTLVDTEAKFARFFKELKKQKQFCFDTETTSLDYFEAKLLGVSFSWGKAQAFYLTLRQAQGDKWMKKLKPIFEDAHIKKIAHHMKFDIKMLRACCGIETQGIYFDTMIASYLLAPGSRAHKLDNLVFRELKHTMISLESVAEKNKGQMTLTGVDVNQVSEYSCEDADYTLRLMPVLEKQLRKNNLWKVFTEIEMPLIEVLADMEFNGILIDTKYLNQLAQKVKRRLTILEKKIYKIAGKEFNIASPLQLKQILFEKLKISTQGLKKIKTGISTAAPELEKMRGRHEIIDLISEFRELSKLVSTYLDALPRLVQKKTGRVHTDFNQTITATGRLSSSKPNLQNIPIRTELGREIRKAFIAGRGFQLVAADYSQVELRVIACLAEDKAMMEIFARGEDIHTATAAKIFNVALEKVTKDQRRAAKEVNFGVLYGMGAWGLALRKKISREQAQEFIEKYFATFKDVKKYVEKMKEDAREHGYVETIFGRRRYLPEIHSGVHQVRAAAERMAINHPIQGTAADLMKIAMIEVYKDVRQAKARMLLQVHDELVFEVPTKQVKKLAKIIDEKMEKVHKLCVPINVDTEVGKNWKEMKIIY